MGSICSEQEDLSLNNKSKTLITIGRQSTVLTHESNDLLELFESMYLHLTPPNKNRREAEVFYFERPVFVFSLRDT